MNRRDFIGSLAVIGCSTTALAENCGPLSQAKPQYKSSSEGYAPLPYPVTPLRRTESKRPPSPPILVGKVILGNKKWVTNNGKRELVGDWKTDIDDMSNLLSFINTKLGINYKSEEVDLNKFSFDPKEIPILYFTGHEKFTLSEDIQKQLQRFILDGGFIIGDCCCGSLDFYTSFTNIFKDLRPLSPDSPLLSSYYKLEQPERPILTYDVWCRIAIVLLTADMSCGWSGHDHKEGTRFPIEYAQQFGTNLVTYMLGTFNMGQQLSTQKVYHEQDAPTRDDFVFCQLMYDGQWKTDPSGPHNLLKFARDNSTLEVKFKVDSKNIMEISSEPLVYMTGHNKFTLTKQELAHLNKYLKAGGTLFVDSCCGSLDFGLSFLGYFDVKRLPLDHPIYSSHFKINNVKFTKRVEEDYGIIREPQLFGKEVDGRLAIIYSSFDLGCAFEQIQHPYSYGYDEDSAFKIGTNIITYAITH